MVNYHYASNIRLFNPTKVTGVAVLLTSRNIIQIHQIPIMVSAVLYTAQSLTQLHQTGQKSSPKGRSAAVIANRTSDWRERKLSKFPCLCAQRLAMTGNEVLRKLVWDTL